MVRGGGWVAGIVLASSVTLVAASPAYAGKPRAHAVTVTEGAPAKVKVRFHVQQKTKVKYATRDGSARAGADYTPVKGKLTFTPKDGKATVTIPTLGDAVSEGVESFSLVLTLGKATTTVPITIEDATAATPCPVVPTPTVSVTGGGTFPESAGSVTFTVHLSAPTPTPVFVDYVTVPGTATAGSDFVPTANRLGFAACQTSRTFSVTLINDSRNEADETFSAVLSNPIHATLGGSPATVTITSEDTFQVVSAARNTSTTVDVYFNGDVNDGSLNNGGSQFTLDGGATVSNAVLLQPDVVELTTSALTLNDIYTVTVGGVPLTATATGDPVDPSHNSWQFQV
jgi:hypothetical protein